MSKLENNTASLQAVSEKINGVNNEINSQATTIAEIAALLDGKGVPGGAAIETCHVTIDGSKYVYYTGVENGLPVFKASEGASSDSVHEFYACKNTAIICCSTRTTGQSQDSYGNEYVNYNGLAFRVAKITGDAFINFNTTNGPGGSN